MDYTEVLSRLAVSLAIGLLVGLERGWRTRGENDHQRAAGFRTFALTGLLGGVTGALSHQADGLLVGFVFVIYAAAFAAFHWLGAKAEKNISVTSVVAGMLTFLLGTMAVTGELVVAIACAVAMTVLLALRDQLHRWIASLTWPEIRAVLVLLAMSFLLLPVLPNRSIDPWDSINPHDVWLLTVSIAAISFSGYVAVKVFGDRLGVIMTAVAGGLASSTATTLTLARLGREHQTSSRLLSAGILLAGVVMMIRVGFIAVALNGALYAPLHRPLVVSAAVLALGSAILLFGNTEKERPKLRLDNPLAIGTALKLAAFIAGVMLAAEILRGLFGNLGVLVVAALSGVADVDAVTISMARMNGKDIDLDTTVLGILIAVAINTASKSMLAGWFGGRRIGILVGGVGGTRAGWRQCGCYLVGSLMCAAGFSCLWAFIHVRLVVFRLFRARRRSACELGALRVMSTPRSRTWTRSTISCFMRAVYGREFIPHFVELMQPLRTSAFGLGSVFHGLACGALRFDNDRDDAPETERERESCRLRDGLTMIRRRRC